MQELWKPGQTAVLRGIFNDRVWLAQSTLVVKDTLAETALLLPVGAQCAFPEGYFRWRRGDFSEGTRWQEALAGAWRLKQFDWLTNRFLVLLEPDKYYATFLIWNQASGAFECYYINFQLPYRRSLCGFDTLDLDLDLVVAPDFTWKWKDEDEYREAIRLGGIRPDWACGVEDAQPDVFTRLEHRIYPFDGAWVAWRPDPIWARPILPKGWDRVRY